MLSDPAHCGQCGAPCPGLQRCAFGRCECPLEWPDDCGGSCTDLDSDAQNCGGCGHACPNLHACIGGRCACPLEAPDECGLACTDLRSDRTNCGVCGKACGLGEQCLDGLCRCPVTLPNRCGSTCVDLDSDWKNCGGCGNVCLGLLRCREGVCRCPTELPDQCAGLCTNLQADQDHCGSCGHACLGAQRCYGGSCECPQAMPDECPAGACADFQTDADNCGGCGIGCGAGRVCAAGACVCAPLFVDCLGQCSDLQTDPNNCGACGTRCPSGSACEAGTCGPWCPGAVGFPDQPALRLDSPLGFPHVGSATVGDLDHDGVDDLVFSAAASVSVYRGNGGGEFSLVSTLAGTFLAVGLQDLDGDGWLDLWGQVEGAAQYSAFVKTFRNLNGTFTPWDDWVPTDGLCTRMAWADMDADGALDLVCPVIGYGFSVRYASGNAERFAASSTCYALAAADLDLDGQVEVVCGHYLGRSVNVYRRNLLGRFSFAGSYGAGVAVDSLAAMDLDGDGYPESSPSLTRTSA
ncbi:MAG: FG-GAP-like repeat-containing protein [Myxococcales bacterium]